MKIIFRQNLRRVYVNTICSLMQSVLALHIMKYLSNTNAISGCNYRSFIIFILIFSQRLLRTNKERIFAFV